MTLVTVFLGSDSNKISWYAGKKKEKKEKRTKLAIKNEK